MRGPLGKWCVPSQVGEQDAYFGHLASELSTIWVVNERLCYVRREVLAEESIDPAMKIGDQLTLRKRGPLRALQIAASDRGDRHRPDQQERLEGARWTDPQGDGRSDKHQDLEQAEQCGNP